MPRRTRPNAKQRARDRQRLESSPELESKQPAAAVAETEEKKRVHVTVKHKAKPAAVVECACKTDGRESYQFANHSEHVCWLPRYRSTRDVTCYDVVDGKIVSEYSFYFVYAGQEAVAAMKPKRRDVYLELYLYHQKHKIKKTPLIQTRPLKSFTTRIPDFYEALKMGSSLEARERIYLRVKEIFMQMQLFTNMISQIPGFLLRDDWMQKIVSQTNQFQHMFQDLDAAFGCQHQEIESLRGNANRMFTAAQDAHERKEAVEKQLENKETEIRNLMALNEATRQELEIERDLVKVAQAEVQSIKDELLGSNKWRDEVLIQSMEMFAKIPKLVEQAVAEADKKVTRVDIRTVRGCVPANDQRLQDKEEAVAILNDEVKTMKELLDLANKQNNKLLAKLQASREEIVKLKDVILDCHEHIRGLGNGFDEARAAPQHKECPHGVKCYACEARKELEDATSDSAAESANAGDADPVI